MFHFEWENCVFWWWILWHFRSGGETTEASSDDEPVERTQDPPVIVDQRPRRPRPPPSPASNRKSLPLAGTSLKLKKGRRARHRYDSERSLFAFADIDPEEAPEGWDIAQENSSHFTSLLDNQELLDQFLNDEQDSETEDFVFIEDGGSEDEERDPEACFMRISGHLRRSLKKHIPWGMLAYLEEQILEHFSANPQETFVTSNLNSYERLLAHICCMYNQLNSQSKFKIFFKY